MVLPVGRAGIPRTEEKSSSSSSSTAFPLHGLTTAEVLLEGMRHRSIEKLPAGTFPLHLLIVESDATILRPLMEVGKQLGFTVHGGTANELAPTLGSVTYDVVLLDLNPTAPSLELLKQIRREYPRVPILVTTAFASVQTAREALRVGATDLLTKPFSLEELTTTLHVAAERRSFDVELRRVQHQMRTSPALQELASASPAMQKLLSMVSRVAVSQHPVLVLGESGTGKERIARMLHAAAISSQLEGRQTKEEPPFHHVLCSTSVTASLETELFGYVRGEGTPQREEHIGLLTDERGGTLFLDEVDALPLDLQSKLLRALQQKSVRPPGSGIDRPVTVRVVASSSNDLPALVERGSFRKDLYFRLNVVNLRVPPLRQRKEDIPLLAVVFLERYGQERHLSFTLGPEAMSVLLEYAWPGNVREMESVLARACSVSSGPVLHLADLPSQLLPISVDAGESTRIDIRPPVVEVRSEANSSIESIAEMERKAILATLNKLNGDKLMTAKLLGIGKTTLYRKLKEYGIADV